MKKFNNIMKGVVVLAIIPISWLFIRPVTKVKTENLNKGIVEFKDVSAVSNIIVSESVTNLIGSPYVIEINFYGDAQRSSKLQEKEIVLQIQKEKGWAYAQINFANSIDLLANSLSFMVKAKNIGQKLKISLTDINKWTSVASDNYCVDLTDDWQRVIINTNSLKDLLNIDKTRVASIKLIIDQRQDVENAYQISIKDLKLAEKSN